MIECQLFKPDRRANVTWTQSLINQFQEKESRRLFQGLEAVTAKMQMFDRVSVVQVTTSLKSLHLSPKSGVKGQVRTGEEKL